MPRDVLHHLDSPAAWDLTLPNLIVRGWCVDRAGDSVVAVELEIHGRTLAAPVGLPRPDVAAALGHTPGAGTSGFCFHVASRALGPGTARLRAVHRDGTRTDLREVLVAAPPAAS